MHSIKVLDKCAYPYYIAVKPISIYSQHVVFWSLHLLIIVNLLTLNLCSLSFAYLHHMAIAIDRHKLIEDFSSNYGFLPVIHILLDYRVS